MLLLRKIDYYTQVVIGVLMIISIPVLLLYGFLAGLFVIGCIQLLSAAFNTRGFLMNSFSKQIGIYWKWTALILSIILISIVLSVFFDPDDMQVPACVAVAGSVPVAVYYLHIYNKLIQHIALKKELGGFTKSKY